MPRGTVKWFNDAKGYGFIQRTGGEDVYVHFSEIESQGFRTLNEGDVVEFEIRSTDQGPRATQVNRPH
jgi:CspA family cold shock protein